MNHIFSLFLISFCFLQIAHGALWYAKDNLQLWTSESPECTDGCEPNAIKKVDVASNYLDSKNYSAMKIQNDYAVRFENFGNYQVFLMNSMGQFFKEKNVQGNEIKFLNLSKGNYFFKVLKR